MAESGMSMPSGMGGLMRYNEEYPSRISFTPNQIVIMIAAVVIGMAIIKIAF